MTWPGLKNLNLLLRNLTLRYPTWLSLSDGAVKAIMPRSRSDEVVIFHSFVGFKEARNEPDDGQPRLEVKPTVSLGMTLIHVNHVVPCESQSEMLVESIDAA